jgi:dihydrolipoamide dehydrogenase
MMEVMKLNVEQAEIIIIGAGPGGYVAAIRAAQLGKQVVLIEKSELGGVCLNHGCIPSKSLIHAAEIYEQTLDLGNSDIGISSGSVTIDFIKVQKWKDNIIKQLRQGIEGLMKKGRIQIVKGSAVFTSPNSVEVKTEANTVRPFTFEYCIIATGSSPLELSAFPFSERILSSTDILQLSQIPQRLMVMGGGYIGVELGQAFAKLGSKVTVIESADRILTAFDQEIANLIQKRMKQAGMDVLTNVKVLSQESSETGIMLTYRIGDEMSQVEGDYLLVAVGRNPNTGFLSLEKANVTLDAKGMIQINLQCQTSNPRIYAIGDVTQGPALAHRASYQAQLVAEIISGKPYQIDYKAIPAVIYSDPEVAYVGLTEKDAKLQNIPVKIGKSHYRASGRARTMNATQGFVKLIADASTGCILGAEIIGKEASNLIAEVALAIEMQTSLEDMALTIHAHPTFSEMWVEASLDALGQAIHG